MTKYIAYSFGLLLGAWIMIASAGIAYSQTVGALLEPVQNYVEDEEVYIEKGMELTQALEILEQRFDVVFLYRSEVVENTTVIQSNRVPNSIARALSTILEGSGLAYKYISPKTYGIYAKNEEREEKYQPDDRRISGTVTDAEGKPIPGVNVLVMGTNIGTVTNNNGYYEIVVSGEGTLMFSMVGFETHEVETRSLEDNELDLVLEEETVGLDELVVLGYSEVQSQHVASSVSTIDIDRVKSGPVGKLQEVFKGTLPGVSLMQGSNLPGEVPGTIQVRGISTLNNASPLVIIDGIEQSLTDIDPNQVRNITVLKDAASASMYGSRGANGVILIETERGVSDRFKVDLHTWTAMHDPIDLPDFVNSADFMMLRNEARDIQGQSSLFSDEEIEAARTGQTPNTDWLDTIMQRQAYSHNTSANISGGGGVGTFNLMIGYNQEGGLNPYEGTDKFSTRFNTNINIADRFVLLADFYAHRLQVDRLYANNDGHGLYQIAWRMNPTQEVFYNSDLENHYALHNKGFLRPNLN